MSPIPVRSPLRLARSPKPYARAQKSTPHWRQATTKTRELFGLAIPNFHFPQQTANSRTFSRNRNAHRSSRKVSAAAAYPALQTLNSIAINNMSYNKADKDVGEAAKTHRIVRRPFPRLLSPEPERIN